MFKIIRDLLRGKYRHSGDFLADLREERAASYQLGPQRFTDLPSDGKYWQGLTRLTAGYNYFTSDQMLRQHGRADWNHTPVELRLFAARLIGQMRKHNVPFYVHTALRTKEDQNAAFDRGVSRLKYPRAPHCQGAAVDIVHSVHHWDLTRQEWDTVGHIGKLIAQKMGLDITWGGDWRAPWDPAHWELKGWQDNVRPLPTLPPLHLTPVKILKDLQGHL